MNSWEIGSNNSEYLTITGLDELKSRLRKLASRLSATEMREALRAGAKVYQQAIIDATPTGRDRYAYLPEGASRTHVIVPRRPLGTAKGSVIIYERKQQGGLVASAADTSILIGFEKRSAYYMYWYEMGRSNQSARPFFRRACEAVEPRAIEAFEAVINKALAEEIGAD